MLLASIENMQYAVTIDVLHTVCTLSLSCKIISPWLLWLVINHLPGITLHLTSMLCSDTLVYLVYI